MTIERHLLAIVSVTFLMGTAPYALAQGGGGSSLPQDQTGGASGRGVRIIAPETPAPEPVAKRQQPLVPASPPNAARPAPTTAIPSATPATMPSMLKPCERPVAKPALRFADPSGFDRLLRGKLRSRRTVAVDMETPYPVDHEAPAPLGAWLNEVQKSGGMITVAPYCQKGRGFGDFLSRVFGGGPAEPYKAARKYDATLHVDSIDQVVTQVEFTPRRAGR